MKRILAIAAFAVVPAAAGAQWVQTHEQFYLEAPHNWQFRDRYMAADRLFNAFDFGHAILYERLWRAPNAPASELEETWYNRLTKDILIEPPRVPLEESAIEVAYVKIAPEAKQMFDWAHILHRQIYDVLADERLSEPQKDSEVARLVAYYRTRRDLAFSDKPKSMELMEGQPYSLAFKKGWPKFNGLIWAYHWLQVGLYEPLLVGRGPEERQTMVRATVARFWQMLGDPPRSMPTVMPMTATVSPVFATRFPDAAIIFDNLHSMHDVISDILANPSVPRNRKRAEILIAARRFRDDTSYVMTREAWLAMSRDMGLENMGGPPVGFMPALPTPTMAAGGAHAGHGAAAAQPAQPSAGQPSAPPSAPAAGGDVELMNLYMRMLGDSAIVARIKADTTLQQMIRDGIKRIPVEHREHLEMMLRDAIRP